MFYLAPEAWERYKLFDMHDDLKQSQREASHARARATESVETLEENLSRALLLVRALTEALVRKGPGHTGGSRRRGQPARHA